MFPRLIISTLFVVLLSASVFAGESVPTWLRQSTALTAPAYEKDVPAVVLHHEQQVSLGTDGKLVTVENYAIKLLLREGKNLAIARAFYLMSFSKVRDINAWLIRPDGTVKEYDKKTVLDIISDQDDIYNEGRLKIIDASDDADAGFVFGYSSVIEDQPLFYQDIWSFQSSFPTLVSRYTLNLPAGWKASSITFNHADVKPQVNGTSYTWEMRNLAPIPDEPLSPSVRNLAPRIAVNYAPENNAQTINRTFSDWAAVSRFSSTLNDPQVIVDDAVAIKTRDLTNNAKTEFEKIRAIGSYVQNLQYISIDIGVGYGNGMKPRPSNLVLSRGYGDCKDKANLMRAMLRVLKIESYPIAIYSGDPNFVREEWASPSQFNHAILAVKVSDETNAPTILNHPKLGRLLIFDATDPHTPVGDLPDYLQGSLALIEAGDDGGLIKMPLTPPETDLLERKIEVSLTETGMLSGKISERASGQTSTVFRREVRGMSATDYKKAIEGWLTRGATGAKLVNMSLKDREQETGFDLDVEFSAPSYGQLMQNRLLVFKPVIVGRRNGIFLTEAKRKNPIEMDSNAMKETIVFTLPANFTVDEMPDAVNLEMPFGKYSTKYEVKDGKLFFTRSLTTTRTTVPVDKYNTVKDFYSKILAAEQSPVVLLRK